MSTSKNIAIALSAISLICSSCQKTKTTVSEYDYRSNGGIKILPQLPVSAEKRLLDAINGYVISDISELSYTTGVSIYLGIDGYFGMNYGDYFYHSFVLKIERGEESWANAKVYKWPTSTISFKNTDEEEVVHEVYTVSELFSLPENVMTNLLFEIKYWKTDLVWRIEDYDRFGESIKILSDY